jgi:hypothetical protein
MPAAKTESRPSGRNAKPKTRAHVIAEATRLAHDIAVKAQAIESSPHPILALEQLEADLELAGHLARDARALINELR